MENATAAINSTALASNTTDLHTALYEPTQDVLIYGAVALIFIIGLFIHVLVTYAALVLGEKIPPKGECSMLKIISAGSAMVGGFMIYALLAAIYAAAFDEAGSPKWLGMTIGASIALGVQAASMAIGLMITTLLALVIGSKSEAKDESQSFLEQGAWPKGAEVNYDEEGWQSGDKFDRRASF